MGWVLLWIWVWCRHCSNDCLLVQFKESTGGQEHTQSEVMSNFDTFIHQQCLPEQYWGLSGNLGIFCNINILPGYITLRFIMICLISPLLKKVILLLHLIWCKKVLTVAQLVLSGTGFDCSTKLNHNRC